MRVRIALLVASVATALVALPAGNPAASSGDLNLIYWGDNVANKIAEANLDGTGNGSNLTTTGATVSNPTGTALDPADNKIFWTNAGGNKISFANLDGTGAGGDLVTTGATAPSTPVGIAVDPANNKVYWANAGDSKISFANLDNTGGGGDLNTTGATANNPQGVAIDPANNRIYWANAAGGNKISYANLDNTGNGHDVVTTGASVNQPVGVAVDPAAGRIYWANAGDNTISFADLSGTGGANLATTGATAPNLPSGVAIDPSANKIYWTSKNGGKVSEANLDGTGNGHDLSTSGATASHPNFPALLEGPLGTGVPQVTGGTSAGSTLSCTKGSWASDMLSALLYRAPRSFAFQWTFNGADITGATAGTYMAPSAGSYACRVTASNQAGSSSQTSGAVTVTGTGGPPPPTASLSLSGVSQSHRRWREGNRLPHIASARPPVGTTFRFTVNESVKVRFAFTQRRHGHRVTRGTLRFSVSQGAHKVRFQGRVSKHKRLKPGRYTLVITATNAAGQHTTKRLTFTIVKG
jgi:6-phosphogluconolactonase (cycloisomerase 2 family)